MSRIAGRIRYIASVLAECASQLKELLFKTRLSSSTPVRLITRVIQEMGHDDTTHMAASVSFFAILSLFPLMVGLSAIFGVVADSPGRQEDVVDFIVEFLPGSEEFLRDSLEGTERFGSSLGVLAIFGLLWAGSAVFSAITKAVNRAWDIQYNRPFYKSKPEQIGMALGLGVVFTFSVAITGLLQWATAIQIGNQSVSDMLGGSVVTVLLKLPAFVISFAMYLFLYKFLPDTKVYWRDVWLGAILAGALFEIGKNLFLWFLDHFARFDQLYGNVASIAILMVWVYATALILILGAKICSEYARMRRGIERDGIRAVAPENRKSRPPITGSTT